MKTKPAIPKTLVLFHGGDQHEGLDQDRVFFSRSETFSKYYGEVQQYEVTFERLFDSLLEEDVTRLIHCVGSLFDTYEGEHFRNFEELEQSGLSAHDDWALFEPFMDEMIQMGYDGLRIFEGGCENYVTFNRNQYRLLQEVAA